MAYWIFIVTRKKTAKGEIPAEDVLNTRLKDKFWGLGQHTPNRQALKKGDSVIFYVGLPKMTFAASARLLSDSFQLTEAQRLQYGHNNIEAYQTEYGVLLEEIRVWSDPRSVKDLVPRLSFIENKENWYSYFQGGVRQLCEDDYRLITQGLSPSLIESIQTTADLVSESQFALEAHLEEFIDQNWDKIDFGFDLERYQTDEQNGRQFPAGPWSIDFLCIDRQNRDLVVIELKRGKTSDATVGQLLRYMGWVSTNLAEPNQTVRGIVIAQEVDDALRYAISGLSNVHLLTYKVDFNLVRATK